MRKVWVIPRFWLLSLINDPLDLATYGAIENYLKFATLKRVVNTRISTIQIGPNILNVG